MSEAELTSEITDGLLYAKLPDGRVLQVVLSRSQALSVIAYAATLNNMLRLLDKEAAINWERPFNE